MSLKRRNLLAWLLLVLAAAGWMGGIALLRGSRSMVGIAVTTPAENTSIYETHAYMPTYYRPTMPTMESTYYQEQESIGSTEYIPNRYPVSPLRKVLGFGLCLGSVIAACFAIFVFRQQQALIGPDGIALVITLLGRCRRDLVSSLYPSDIWLYGLFTLLALVALRELVCWIRGRFSLRHTLLYRLGQLFPVPQLTLAVYGAALALPLMVVWQFFILNGLASYPVSYLGLGALELLAICCMWQYGRDLHHLRRQLECFEKALPITVGNGAFADTEAKLQQLQKDHENAIRAAVTSERFKVELIANVSHDLRTPLTAILGYGELLEKQQLPADAQKQLELLNQKAGYMRDLVDSLFELTKVSSGAVQSKQEQIDMLRLLEQTLGLFDDQLSAANLTVRRHYSADTLPVVTDGARMHQVFANLLGNAIKYALPGTRIHLEAAATETGCRVRMVNISAYEMNFTPEEILQRFARGDQARTTKGSGLGLAIAQTYTESVGGRFRVEIDGDQFSAIVEL